MSAEKDPAPRQRVERVAGSRRARLTRVAGTLSDSEAEATLRAQNDTAPSNDPVVERLRREKPPHY